MNSAGCLVLKTLRTSDGDWALNRSLRRFKAASTFRIFSLENNLSLFTTLQVSQQFLAPSCFLVLIASVQRCFGVITKDSNCKSVCVAILLFFRSTFMYVSFLMYVIGFFYILASRDSRNAAPRFLFVPPLPRFLLIPAISCIRILPYSQMPRRSLKYV